MSSNRFRMALHAVFTAGVAVALGATALVHASAPASAGPSAVAAGKGFFNGATNRDLPSKTRVVTATLQLQPGMYIVHADALVTSTAPSTHVVSCDIAHDRQAKSAGATLRQGEVTLATNVWLNASDTTTIDWACTNYGPVTDAALTPTLTAVSVSSLN
jgi:zinc transporter ZupT